MTHENASPRKAQAEAIRRNKLNPLIWAVMDVLDHKLIVRHRIPGEVKAIDV